MVSPISDRELERALEAAKGTTLDAVLESVLQKGLIAVGTEQGSLMLLNERENALEIIKRHGPPFDPKRKHRRFKVGQGIAGWVAQHCRPYVSPDVNLEPRFVQPLGGLNFRSLMVVPIVRDGHALGVICADSHEPDKFNDSHVEALSHLAQNVADAIGQLALDNFISYAKRVKQLESLYDVGKEFSQYTFASTDDLPRLLDKIAKTAEQVLEADLVTLYQYYEDTRQFEKPPTRSGKFEYPELLSTSTHPHDAPHQIVGIGAAYYSEIAHKDNIMSAGEIPARPPFVEREGVVSSVGVPLRAGRETVGVMFVNYRIPHAFADDEKPVIENFATYAALAIKGARQVRETIRLNQREALHLTSQSVAHRLRNVLPIVSDRLDRVLTQGTVTGIAVDWCRMALDETRKAQKIVKDFEIFSRAEVFDCPDNLSANSLVDRLAGVVRKNLTQDSANIEVLVSANAPSVQINLDRLEDDFANFARDSEKYKTSGLHIVISSELADQNDIWRHTLPARCLKLTYSDNGPGVPLESKERIMEPFVTTTSGSGLGLAIASHNARVHGGTLTESGKPGKGVRFELYIPAVRIVDRS